MKQKVKRGLIYLGALGLLLTVLTHPTGQVKFPSDKPTQIVSKKATWEEKKRNKKLAKKYAWVAFGWGKREQTCLLKLWTRESRFDHYATNQQGSSAFGIAQLLGERSLDPRVQILRGMRYIDDRYGSPCRAWSHWNRVRPHHY